MYYRYLDLPWEPAAEQIRSYLKLYPDIIAPRHGSAVLAPLDILDKCPAIKEMFKSLTIRHVGLYVSYAPQSGIHVDDSRIVARINFPVLNCENTETRFYKTTEVPTLVKQLNGNILHRLSAVNCEMVDRYFLTQAVVVNVLQPHQVIVNHNNYPRIGCTVTFNEDISNLLLGN